MMDTISLQYNKEGVFTACVQAGMGHMPLDSDFTDGGYQDVYMERGEGAAYIKSGKLIPDRLILVSHSQFNQLRTATGDGTIADKQSVFAPSG